MKRRRNTINIYDYPEHLNPFREEAQDNDEKFNTIDERCSSSLVNARNLFSQNESKSEDSPSTLAKLTSPQESLSPVSLRLAHRSTSSPCAFLPTSSRPSLTPSSSPSALHSSNSRSMLPPNDSHNTVSSSPSKAAPQTEHNSLSRSRPLLASAVASTTANAPNDVNTVRNQRTSSSEKSVREQASKDETKFIQQGTRSKKKLRAPATPTASPGKSNSDEPQVNSNDLNL
jgi:hypothetical protein